MKNLTTILTLTLLTTFVKAKTDDYCWSEDLYDDPFPCCKSDNVDIVGENMNGSWGLEDGKICGIKSKGYNWNLRDKVEETREEWEAFKIKWDEEYKDNFERIAITPGTNESFLNFGWESKTDYEPKIRISENSDMSNYKTFNGTNDFYRILSGDNYYSNKVTVEGLEHNKNYYYQRLLNDEWEPAVKFSTSDPNNFKFGFVGDPQIGGSNGRYGYHTKSTFGYTEATRNDAFNWNITVNRLFELTDNKPSLLLSAGDQADTMGSDESQEEQYSGLLLPEKLKSIPIAAALGNHENLSESFRRHFNLPNPYIPRKYNIKSIVASYNYYFKYNNVLVVVIESNDNNCFDCGIIISKAVEEYPDADWRVALFHHDIYGNGATHSQSDGDGKRLRSCLTGLFDIYNFDLVINGHDHVYTTTNLIKYLDDGDKGSYKYLDIEKGKANENVDGTFFITANCGTGSKFMEVIKNKSYDYVYNHGQTYTATLGIIDFENKSGKTKMCINIYEVDSKKVLDGPYIFEKDSKKNEVVKDEKCWSTQYGYPCCKTTNDIKYNVLQGSWGFEDGNWCGIVKNEDNKCWAYNEGYLCCKKTKNVQLIEKDGSKYGFEDGSICAFDKDATDLNIVSENCWGLKEGYQCCESLYNKVKGNNNKWGVIGKEWCALTEEQQEEYYKLIEDNCWAKKLGFKCCINTSRVEATDKYGEWGIEDNNWCGIVDVKIPKTTRTIAKTTTTTTTTSVIPPMTTTTTTTSTIVITTTTTTTTKTIPIITTTTTTTTITSPVETPTACWSEKLGYPCCKNTEMILMTEMIEGQIRNWGAENNQWCGIVTINNECWSARLGYPCCSQGTEVVSTDANGKWGIENGIWCGIIETNRTTTKTIPIRTTKTVPVTSTITKTTKPILTTTTTSTTTTLESTPTKCIDKYDKCGGIDYNESVRCCDPEFECKFINEYYSQCLPKSAVYYK